MSLHSIDLHEVFLCHGYPHHVAFFASHSSPLERSSTPSPHVPVSGDPGDHGGGPPGPLHERVFAAVHSWGVLEHVFHGLKSPQPARLVWICVAHDVIPFTHDGT